MHVEVIRENINNAQDKINQWLQDNENKTIHHIKQDTYLYPKTGVQYLVVSIWYDY